MIVAEALLVLIQDISIGRLQRRGGSAGGQKWRPGGSAKESDTGMEEISSTCPRHPLGFVVHDNMPDKATFGVLGEGRGRVWIGLQRQSSGWPGFAQRRGSTVA